MFEVGVIDVIVLNRPKDDTVLPSVGPVTVSVLVKPAVSVPTIVKVLLLSFAVDVMDALVPEVDPKLDTVPTLIPFAPPSDDICVTVLKNFVPLIVFELTPVIVSVWAFPSTSVPVIVKVTEALLDELDIFIVDFRSDDAVLERAPSIVKFPELPSVSLSTNPSLSATTEFNPLIINEVSAVPAWEVAIEFRIVSEVPLKRALILFSSGPSTTKSPDTILSS